MRNNKVCQLVVGFFALFGFLTFLAGGYVATTNQYNLMSLVKVYQLLDARALKERSPQQLVEGAMRGMVGSLNDPYSAYLSKEEFEELGVRLQGRFSGIGVVVAADEDERIRVVAPIKGTPAAKVGIKSGDIITKINGESTKGMTIEQAVRLIRGETGTQVEISVYREGEKKEYDFRIIRKEIKVDSVDAKMVSRDPPIGYIQISQFTATTPEEFRKHTQKVLNEGAEGLILDLREDPGGDFKAAVEVADILLDKGVIVKVANRKGTSEIYEATPGGLGLPLAVLVNKGSASSAEILAGALKDNKAAVLVGEKTFGKGLVQTVFPLPGGGALKLTTDKYYTPKGIDINQIGIVPDHVVEGKIQGGKDLQLDKAVELLRETIKTGGHSG